MHHPSFDIHKTRAEPGAKGVGKSIHGKTDPSIGGGDGDKSSGDESTDSGDFEPYRGLGDATAGELRLKAAMKAKLDEIKADKDKMAVELRLAQDRLLEAQSRSREAAEESEARMLKVLKIAWQDSGCEERPGDLVAGCTRA